MTQHKLLNLAFVDQAVVSGANFLTGVLLARFLGIEEFGRFTLVWMMVLLVNMVQQSLLLQPMMSLGPKQPAEERPDYVGALLLQQGLFCLLSISLTLLIGLGVSFYFPGWQVEPLIVPLAAVIVAFQAQDFIRRYFFTRQRILDAFWNDLISYGGQVILLIGFFMATSLGTDGVLWIIALTSAVAAFVGVLRLEPVRWNATVFKETLLKHWDFSRWLVAGSFMQWIGGQFFVMAAAALLSTAAAGAIAAARNILGLTLILFATMENVISVQASLSFKQGGWPSLRRYVSQVSLFGGVLNGLICLTAALFAPFLMTTLFGEGYLDYAYLVYWFAFTHFLMFFIRPLTSLLRAVEWTYPIAASSILPMLFSVAASVPLINKLGLTGAMVVMVGTQVLILLHLLGATLHWRREQGK